MSLHSKEDQIKLSRVLAKEVLKLEKLCKEGEKDDELLEYQLSQVARLARLVCADTGEYNEDDSEVIW